MEIRKIILAATIFLASSFIFQPANAAEVTCIGTQANSKEQFVPAVDILKKRFPSGRLPSASTCLDILIRGDIETGDSIKFLKILRENHPFVDGVYLISAGGSVEEAIKIGRLVRKYMLGTHAPFHNTLSPKSVEKRLRIIQPLVIAGNARNAESAYPRDPDFVESVRIKSEQNYEKMINEKINESEENYKADEGNLPLFNGQKPAPEICRGADCNCASSCFLIWSAGAMRLGDTLGIHRPSIHSSDFANLPPDKASTVYKQELSEISQYLSDMEVPQKYIGIMTDTASNDIYWLEDYEAEPIEEYPPSIAESMSASCGMRDKKEIDEMNKIELVLPFLKVSEQERDKAIYKKLNDKMYQLIECVVTKIDNYRDSITSVE